MHPRYCHVADAETSALTVGETRVYSLHCAWAENLRNPTILWLSKITGNWRRTLEHEQGHLECYFWEGRECNALVHSQELETGLWPPGLRQRATDCFVSLCNQKLRAQVRCSFMSGLSARMLCPHSLFFFVALGGWRLALHSRTAPRAVLPHRIQTLS